MYQFRTRMGTSSLERNNRDIQASRNGGSGYSYNNLTSISSFSQPTNTQANSIDHSNVIRDLQINVSSLSVTYGIFNDMIHKFSAELAKVKNERDSMADEIAILKDSINGIRQSLGRQLNDGFHNVALEVQDRYERSKNVLVYHIPDSKDETPEMLRAVMVDLLQVLRFKHEFPEIKRLGSYRGFYRPIRLTFKSADYVKMVMKHKTKLHSSEYFKTAWISEDRTASQRLQSKLHDPQSLDTLVNNQIQG